MARGCCRALLAVVSGLVLLLALSLTTASLWLLVVEQLYLEKAVWQDSPALLTLAALVTGLGLGLLAALGCSGAITASRCLLGLFLTLLLLLTAGQVALAVLVFLEEVSLQPLLHSLVRETVEEKYHPNNTATRLYWDHLQQGLQCCGTSGPLDWAMSVHNGYDRNTKEIGIRGSASLALPFTIPSSCCRDQSDPLCSGTLLPRLRPGLDPSLYFTQGCMDQISRLLQEHLLLLATSCLGLLLLETLGVLAGCCLCFPQRREDSFKGQTAN